MSNTTETVGPYTIESGVPLPPGRGAGSIRHSAFNAMKIGDSFHDPDILLSSGKVIASRASRKFLIRLTCRPDPDGGVRFWRVA